VGGEWLGSHRPGSHAAVMVEVVPRTYGTWAKDCWSAHAAQRAHCLIAFRPSSRPWSAATHVGRYDPFCDLLVGWPSLLTASTLRQSPIRIVAPC